jgi:hypothetical protein
MFAGRLHPRELPLPQRASLLVFRGLAGDFRDWGAIKIWAARTADQLAAGTEAHGYDSPRWPAKSLLAGVMTTFSSRLGLP